MKYSNVFYIPLIKKISGITTWLIEMAKKYKDLDITIIYSDTKSDREQINNLKQYVRVLVLSDLIIECDKLYLTYTASETFKYNPRIYNQFKADKKIGVVHTDYKMNLLKPFENVDEVIAVSKKVAKSYEELTGVKCKVIYNPLQVEKKKILKLISCTRITEAKGSNRMNLLAQALDKARIPYIWLILSDNELSYKSDNIKYIKPKIDDTPYILDSDYLVQLSDDDESYSYSINKALSLGVPIISTPLSVFSELGIRNNINGYIISDFSKIPLEVIYNNIPKFEYTPPKDEWGKELGKNKSTYKKEELIKLSCITPYKDIEYDEWFDYGKVFDTDKNRAKMLIDKGLAELESIEPDKNCKYKISVIIPMWEQQDLIVRTLDSIPSRNNVEIIIIDDYSKDNSVKVVETYIKNHKDKNIKLLKNKENKGVGYTFNKGLDNATGDYIVRIDSDDYFYTGQFNYMIDYELDGSDMVFYYLKDNNDRILDVTENNYKIRCGAVKFIRRDFIGNIRCPEIRTAEDKAFNDELVKKNPKLKFTKRIVYHYNYPREGSLYDLTKKGLL